MRTFLALVLALLAPSLALVGCQRADTKPTPPDYIKGFARAEIDVSRFAPTPDWGAHFDRDLRAEAQVGLDPALEDVALGVVMAQAEARRTALRALAAQLLASAMPDGQSPPDPDVDNAEFDRLLEEASRVELSTAGQSVLAVADLDAQQAASLMTLLAPAEFDPARLDDRQRDDMRAEARREAIAAAKSNLKQAVLAQPFRKGRTIGEALANRPADIVELDAMIFVLAPDQVEYPEPGVCEVTLFFDANRARALAARRRGILGFLGR